MGEKSGSNRSPGKGQPFSSQSPFEETRTGQPVIVLVEDNKADVFLVREALQAHGVTAALRVVEDGEQAIQFIQGVEADESASCPSLFLLDVNLPKKSGRDVLVYLRGSRKCGQVPVLVLTSSDSADDREEMKKLGAQRYFRKPSGYGAFMKIGEIIQELLPNQKLQ